MIPMNATHEDPQGEDLLEEELELLALDRTRASEHQLAGGAPRDLAWMFVVGAVIGLYASIQLVLSEMILLADPNANLGCDINPILGCGSSLTQWQSHLLLGLPNALVGTAVFGLVLGVGVMFLANGRVARWFWQLMSLAILGGFAFVAWFAYQSMANLRTLCPWCMVTWAIVIVLGFQVLGRAAQAGHLPVGAGLARVLHRERWLLTIGAFLIIIIAIAISFRTQLSILLGL